MFNCCINEKVGICFEDWEKMFVIVDVVCEMVKKYKDLEIDYCMLIVNFDSYGVFYIEFFIYIFIKIMDWVIYYEIKQDVLMCIMVIVYEYGVEFVFFSCMLYMVVNDEMDDEFEDDEDEVVEGCVV